MVERRDPSNSDAIGSRMSDQDLARFRELIYRLAGIRIPESKCMLVSNRVRPRLRATGIATFEEYYAYLTSPRGAQEVPHFLDAITTNETYFDRDPQQYTWLQESFLPEMAEVGHAQKRPRRLRIWSAACSSGEEAYSIAFRIHAQRARLAGWKIALIGTDLSSSALDAARAARYDARSVRLIGPERRRQLFVHDGNDDTYTVRPEIRELVTWRSHNLLRPLAEPPFDCIFLKNVLIYFDTESKRLVVRNLLRLLEPGGYLVIGLTEGVHGLLESLDKQSPWLYRKSKDSPSPRNELHSTPRQPD